MVSAIVSVFSLDSNFTLIVGLGNPGSRYHSTRHNAGFHLVSAFSDHLNISFRDHPKLFCKLASVKSNGKNWILVKPNTYMNESGKSVSALSRFFKLAPEQCLVLYDDVNLDLGTTRLSYIRNHGGHNGIRSIIDTFGTGFMGYRIGVGPKHPSQIELKHFVLASFSESQFSIINNNTNNYLVLRQIC